MYHVEHNPQRAETIACGATHIVVRTAYGYPVDAGSEAYAREAARRGNECAAQIAAS